MSDAYSSLDPIRSQLGRPPRKLGWFSRSPLAFDEPDWLRNVPVADDPVKEIFGAFKVVWKHGIVVWGRVLRANRDLYEAGMNDCPGTVIFSPTLGDREALELLPSLVDRLNAIREAAAPDPDWSRRETEWWEDLADDMSYHRGFKLPEEWLPPGVEVKGSSVLFHRAHLPEGRISSRMLPLLVDPVSSVAQVIPASYWPDGLAGWLAREDGVVLSSPMEEALEMVGHLVAEPMDGNEREAAYTQACGPIESVSHEVIPVPFHIDVYRFVWPAPRDEVLYLSGGMNNAIQPDAGDFPRIELGFYAKDDDPRWVRLVRAFARYPWETGRSLGPWHTVEIGEHGEAMLGSSRFTALMFFPGLSKSENPIHQHPVMSESETRFLTMVPITTRELEVKLTRDLDVFLERLAEVRFDLAFDPDREELF